uniref:Putative atrophin-1 n=1 Tax=Ixodes ricinus TaxID=34613 RepID=V5GKW2_IXORI
MTTENVPVFAAVASSSSSQAAESQQSHPKASTSDIPALVHVPASLPSDISISSQLDIKPSPSSLIPPFEEQALSPAVPPQPSGSGSGDGSSGAMMMAFTDMSGVPAIAGPSSYHPDNQQSTPSHGKYSRPSPPPLRFPQPLKGRQILSLSSALPTVQSLLRRQIGAGRVFPLLLGYPASGFATVERSKEINKSGKTLQQWHTLPFVRVPVRMSR